MKIDHKRKVPYIEQMQQTECGLCCTAMILRYYKSNEQLAQLREFLDAGRDGLKISQISGYLKERGFETHVYQASMNNLSKLPLPAIIFWNNEHFVVLEEIVGNNYIIVDPAFGRRKIHQEYFDKEFSRIVLTIQPTEDFIPNREKHSTWKPVLKNLIENKLLFGKVLILSIITYLASISIPILVQYLIDDVALANNPELLKKYVLGVSLVILVYGAFTLIRGNDLIELQIGLDRFLNKSTIGKLLKLPYKYFEVRSNGDLLFRLNSLHVIRDIMSEQVLQGILNIGALLFILCYMAQKSIPLTLLSLGLLTLTGIFIL